MVEELTEAEIRAEMETDFFGTLWVTQAVLPVLREQRHSRIIQVTSEGGVRAYAGIGGYHASKWRWKGCRSRCARRSRTSASIGKSFEIVAAEYAERLDTWRKWQPVALAAFG